VLNLGTTPLRALRQAKALTLDELSRRTGMSCTTLGFLDRGAVPTPEQLTTLARAFDLEPGALAITLATGTLQPAKAGAHDRAQ
jgi:transcriptional regulator with XRE-family HTH domain